jgi:hypothetical protein
MSWLKIAAELVRGAMNSREAPPRPRLVNPSDSPSLFEVIQQHRTEIDRSLESLTEEIREQSDRHARAIQAQRRWNYGLLAALLITAALVVVLYVRH